MIQSIFGAMQFDTGWKTKVEIVLFGQPYNITLKARAYYETDGMTAEQEAALSNYQNHREERMRETEELLLAYGGKDCPTRFFPRTLLFERNGEYALLCDDKENPDDGVAVVLFPKQKVILQDDYL